jgi:hypothetical protein
LAIFAPPCSEPIVSAELGTWQVAGVAGATATALRSGVVTVISAC